MQVILSALLLASLIVCPSDCLLSDCHRSIGKIFCLSIRLACHHCLSKCPAIFSLALKKCANTELQTLAKQMQLRKLRCYQKNPVRWLLANCMNPSGSFHLAWVFIRERSKVVKMFRSDRSSDLRSMDFEVQVHEFWLGIRNADANIRVRGCWTT